MRISRRARFVMVVAACLLASGVEAVTFDFAAVGAAEERGYDGVFEMTVDGLTVWATASAPPPVVPTPGPAPVTALSPSGGPFVYLDGPVSGLPGGMGVCPSLGMVGGVLDQCVPGDEDDLSTGELLTLMFSEQVSIAGMLFRDPDHGTSLLGTFLLAVGGGDFVPYGLSHDFTPASALTGTQFTFTVDNGSSNYYIQSLEVEPVPEPATLGLLGSGLAALALRRRRRSRRQVD